MKRGFVYIMTNMPNGTLYTGATSNLAERVALHKTGKGSSFYKRHGLTRLVFVEAHDRIDEAIAREKAIKAWQRTWKIRLISEINPDWDDLYEGLNF